MHCSGWLEGGPSLASESFVFETSFLHLLQCTDRAVLFAEVGLQLNEMFSIGSYQVTFKTKTKHNGRHFLKRKFVDQEKKFDFCTRSLVVGFLKFGFKVDDRMNERRT